MQNHIIPSQGYAGGISHYVVTDMVVSLCCDLLICNIVRRSSCECFEAQAPYAGTFSRTVGLKALSLVMFELEHFSRIV